MLDFRDRMRTGISKLISCLTKFFLRSSCIRVDLLLYESKTTDKRGQYDWRAEKILNGCCTRSGFYQFNDFHFFLSSLFCSQCIAQRSFAPEAPWICTKKHPRQFLATKSREKPKNSWPNSTQRAKGRNNK